MIHHSQSFPSLSINENRREYKLVELIRSTNLIIQQLCLLFLVIALHQVLLLELCSSQVLMVVGVLLFIIASPSKLLSSVLLLSFLAGLSPILKTLTRTISTDSIYYMASILYFLNLLLKSYTIRKGIQLKDGFSINAGFCGSVLLASRLNATTQVFNLLQLSVSMLCFIPYFTISVDSAIFHKCMTTLLLCCTLCIWTVLNDSIAWLIIGLVVFISGISPLLFLYLQRYKTVMNGPWDEPTILDN